VAARHVDADALGKQRRIHHRTGQEIPDGGAGCFAQFQDMRQGLFGGRADLAIGPVLDSALADLPVGGHSVEAQDIIQHGIEFLARRGDLFAP
jgi:hypothetical protein